MKIIRCVSLLFCLNVSLTCLAQQMPQDNWYASDFWPEDTLGTISNSVYGVRDFSGTPSGNLILLNEDAAYAWIVDQAGATVGGFSTAGDGSSISSLTAGGSGRIAYIYRLSSAYFVRVRDAASGASVASIAVPAHPRAVAIGPDNRIYIAEGPGPAFAANKILRYSPSGQFEDEWDRDPSNAESVITAAWGVHVDEANTVYVSHGDHLKTFTTNGIYLGRIEGSLLPVGAPDRLRYSAISGGGATPVSIMNQAGEVVWSQSLNAPSDPSGVGGRTPRGLYLASSGKVFIFVYAVADQPAGVLVLERSYRTFLENTPNRPPQPTVTSMAQRYGSPLIDIDYTVFDPDSSTGSVAMVAFQDGVMDLSHLVKMESFVEGTHVNLGTNIALSGTPKRVTWDPSADFQTNFVDLSVNVMAKDERDLLGLHFLTIPSNGADPELVINRSPITEEELMPAWFWLVGSKDPGVEFDRGEVQSSPVTPSSPIASYTNAIPGVQASYYPNWSFITPDLVRTEALVNYSNTNSWLPASIQESNINVDWDTSIVPDFSEDYTFYITANDGCELWIDQVKILDVPADADNLEHSVTVSLVAGNTVDVKYRFWHRGGAYSAYLAWSSLSQLKEVIPPNKLFLRAADATPLLAEGAATTEVGRLWLFDRLGVREATAAEILRAKEAGHSGLINQFEPRVKVGDHPEKINEYGFDTGSSWPTESWFVVPIAP